MADITQNLIVSREGVQKTDRAEFAVDSLGEPLTVLMRYALLDTEKHVKHAHARLWLTDVPVVFGGAVISSNYMPWDGESTFQIQTDEFHSQYDLIVRQPLDVLVHSTYKIVAESKIRITGPTRKPRQLDSMPTAVADWAQHSPDRRQPFAGPPLLLAPHKRKQEFQLLVDPFGGQVIKKTARIEMAFADGRETGELRVIPHYPSGPGSGRILGDGTGAVFAVDGFEVQRNYTVELIVDGDQHFTWQATTKTGPFYDQLRGWDVSKAE